MKEQDEEKTTGATPPDLKFDRGLGNQFNPQASEDEPNAGHGKMARDPAAVGAGPGNQPQENDTQSENEPGLDNDVKPGAQPDGAASIPSPSSGNESIE